MVWAQLPVHHRAEGADAHRVGLGGELLALHVAGHHHGTLHRVVEEHRGGVEGRRGVDGLDPLQHVLLVGGREDKMAGTTTAGGLNLELVAERRREQSQMYTCILVAIKFGG